MSVLVTACRTQCITAVAGIERTRVTAGGTRTCTLLVLPRTGGRSIGCQPVARRNNHLHASWWMVLKPVSDRLGGLSHSASAVVTPMENHPPSKGRFLGLGSAPFCCLAQPLYVQEGACCYCPEHCHRHGLNNLAPHGLLSGAPCLK